DGAASSCVAFATEGGDDATEGEFFTWWLRVSEDQAFARKVYRATQRRTDGAPSRAAGTMPLDNGSPSGPPPLPPEGRSPASEASVGSIAHERPARRSTIRLTRRVEVSREASVLAAEMRRAADSNDMTVFRFSGSFVAPTLEAARAALRMAQ